MIIAGLSGRPSLEIQKRPWPGEMVSNFIPANRLFEPVRRMVLWWWDKTHQNSARQFPPQPDERSTAAGTATVLPLVRACSPPSCIAVFRWSADYGLRYYITLFRLKSVPAIFTVNQLGLRKIRASDRALLRLTALELITMSPGDVAGIFYLFEVPLC